MSDADGLTLFTEILAYCPVYWNSNFCIWLGLFIGKQFANIFHCWCTYLSNWDDFDQVHVCQEQSEHWHTTHDEERTFSSFCYLYPTGSSFLIIRGNIHDLNNVFRHFLDFMLATVFSFSWEIMTILLWCIKPALTPTHFITTLL